MTHSQVTRKLFALLWAPFIFVATSSPARAVEQWSFTPLPYLPQGSMSVPLSINNDGQVVGYSYGISLSTFIYEGNAISDISAQLPIGTRATSINDAGEIVGVGYPDGFSARSKGVILSDAGSRNLGALVNGGASSATDINNSGQVVGFSENSYYTPETRAVIWNASGISNLGVLAGGSNSYAKEGLHK